MWKKDKHYYRLNPVYKAGEDAGLRYTRSSQNVEIGDRLLSGLELDIFADGFRKSIESRVNTSVGSALSVVALIIVMLLLAPVLLLIIAFDHADYTGLQRIGMVYFITMALMLMGVKIMQINISFQWVGVVWSSGGLAVLCLGTAIAIDRYIAKKLVAGWEKHIFQVDLQKNV